MIFSFISRLFEMRLAERRQALLAAPQPADLTWDAGVVRFLTDRVRPQLLSALPDTQHECLLHAHRLLVYIQHACGSILAPCLRLGRLIKYDCVPHRWTSMGSIP